MTQQATSHPPDLLPTDLLMEFVLGLLAPLLMTGSITDSRLARLAAQQAIEAYAEAGRNQLLTITQIVAFALTALDNLRLSMPAELSLSMKLKLRGNANALNRSSQQATATLDQQRRDTPAPTTEPTPPAPLEDTARIVQQVQTTPDRKKSDPTNPGPTKPSPASLSPTKPDPTKPGPTSPSPNRQRQLSWASAMTDIATECTAELAILPPHQRQTQILRINALTKTAQTLSQGKVPLKSQLLGSTSLQG